MPNSFELDYKTRRKLVEPLLTCDCLATRDARDRLARDLPPEIGHGFERQGSDLDDLDSLVDKCSKYEGGVERLIEQVEARERSAIVCQQIKIAWAEIRICRSTNLSDEFLAEVRRLFEHHQITPELARQNYLRALPRTASGAGQDMPAEAYGCFLKLFDYHAGHALIYLELIAQQIESPIAAENLQRWRARATSLTGVDWDSFRPEIEAVQTGGHYLLIQIAPTRFKRNHYLIQACGKSPGRPDQTYISNDERLLPATKLGTEVESLIHQARQDFQTAEIVIELILPRDLFTIALDRWRFRLRMDSHLTLHHPVVFRWLDRLTDHELRPQWKDKWKAVQRAPYAKQKPRLHWIAAADACPPAETMKSLIHPESGVCAALGFILPEKYDEKSDLLTAALASGSPIALWFRETPRNIPVTEAAFEELLRELNLTELPRRVWEWRREPVDDHFGHQLMLLYDDPDRTPTRPTVQAPS